MWWYNFYEEEAKKSFTTGKFFCGTRWRIWLVSFFDNNAEWFLSVKFRFVCLAAGCSNVKTLAEKVLQIYQTNVLQLFTFPVLQQFGLIFRQRLAFLEISSAEITTIINMNQALTCLVGLANGPVRKHWILDI